MKPLHNPHLLIIAHGSRSPHWNQTLNDFVAQVQFQNRVTGEVFSHVSLGFLEHAEPSIPAALNQAARNGCDIFALPFFLAPGVHVQQDIPEIIRSTGTVLHEEPLQRVVQIQQARCTLLPHIHEADLLAKNVLTRINQARLPPQNTGLILVYYGSKRYPQIWDTMVHRIETIIQEQSNITRLRSVYAGDAVQFSPQPLTEAIESLAPHCERILILPQLYAVGKIQQEIIPQAVDRASCREKVIYHPNAILPDPDLAAQVWRQAAQAAGVSSQG